MTTAQRWALAGALGLFAAFSAYGMRADLPFSRFATEEEQVFYAVKFGSGDFNPHYFLHPPFFAYVLCGLYGATFLAGRVAGWFQSVGDFERLFFTDPTVFFVIGRIFVLILGVTGLRLFFRLARRAYGRADIAILATAFLSCSVAHVVAAHYASTDMPMMVLALLATTAVLDVLQREGRRSYVAAGFLIGLATATKYNAAWIGGALVLAHLIRLRSSRSSWRRLIGWPDLVLGLGMIPAGFLVGCPFALLDYSTFLASYHKLTGELMTPGYHFAAYHAQGPSYLFLMKEVLPGAIGWPLLIVCAIGIGYAWWRRRPEDLFLSIFVLSFTAYVGGWDIIKPRYFIFILPLALLLGARWCVEMADRLRLTQLRPVLLATVWLALVMIPCRRIIHFNRLVAQPPVSVQALQWMQAHVPSGTPVASFAGVPLPMSPVSIERTLAEIQAKSLGQGVRLQRLLRYARELPMTYDVHPLPFPWREDFDESDFDFARQREAGVRYVLVTDEMEQYLADPARYPLQVSYYEQVRRHGRLVRTFQQPRPQVDQGLGLQEYVHIYEVASG